MFISETFMSCPKDTPHHASPSSGSYVLLIQPPTVFPGPWKGVLDVPSRAKHLTVALFSVPAMASTLTVTPCKQRLLKPRLRSPLSLGRNRNSWKTYFHIFSILHTVILMGKYSANLKSCPFICEQNESHTD